MPLHDFPARALEKPNRAVAVGADAPNRRELVKCLVGNVQSLAASRFGCRRHRSTPCLIVEEIALFPMLLNANYQLSLERVRFVLLDDRMKSADLEIMLP